VVHAGTYKELLENKRVDHRQYLSGERFIAVPDHVARVTARN
jgi:excinuclease UvrABC ATPase subunit